MRYQLYFCTFVFYYTNEIALINIFLKLNNNSLRSPQQQLRFQGPLGREEERPWERGCFNRRLFTQERCAWRKTLKLARVSRFELSL